MELFIQNTGILAEVDGVDIDVPRAERDVPDHGVRVFAVEQRARAAPGAPLEMGILHRDRDGLRAVVHERGRAFVALHQVHARDFDVPLAGRSKSGLGI
jgi:hypothetical protein